MISLYHAWLFSNIANRRGDIELNEGPDFNISFWKKNVTRTYIRYRMSSERLIYVQFTSCNQGLWQTFFMSLESKKYFGPYIHLSITFKILYFLCIILLYIICLSETYLNSWIDDGSLEIEVWLVTRAGYPFSSKRRGVFYLL